MVPELPGPFLIRRSYLIAARWGHLTVEFFLLRDCLEMGPSLLKVEAVRVRFLSYSEEAVRQRPFSPRGVRPRGCQCALCLNGLEAGNSRSLPPQGGGDC